MVLAVHSLCKHFRHTRAVDHMSFQVEPGQIFGLLGPNGSGKTTTLGMLLGVTRPDSGSFSWFGLGADDGARRRIGALLETPNFCPWLNGLDNLKLVGSIRRIDHLNSAVEKCLKEVNLYEERRKPFSNYSLGMKHRLALASVMLGDPEVLVLDEPTNGLDAKGIIEVRNIIKDMAQQGKTVILASHILDEVEKVCTHLAVLNKGKVIQSGAVADVLSKDGCIELRSEDLSLLSDELAKFDSIKHMETSTVDGRSTILIQMSEGGSLTKLVKNLCEKGIFLTHIVEKKKSLEAHFLELLSEHH